MSELETRMMTDKVKSREKLEKEKDKEYYGPNRLMSELLGWQEDKDVTFNPNRY